MRALLVATVTVLVVARLARALEDGIERGIVRASRLR